MDTYKVKYNNEEEDTSMVYCISLVDDPANESMFITMAKDRKELIKLSELKEKRQITGVVLIPNQKIYRYNERLNKEFNLVFGEEEIRNLSIDFFKQGYQKNSNINHSQEETIKGLTFFESWIVTDPENDKAKALGFDVPAGTWMATAYVEDDKAWEMAKSGELKGFSIEAFLDFEKIEMSINNKNEINKKEKMSLLKQLITWFSADESIQMKTIESDKGVLTVDSLEVGAMVYQEIEGEMKPLMDAEFAFEGMVYKTDAEGKISEVTEYVEEENDDSQSMEDIETPPTTDEEDKKEDDDELNMQKLAAVKTATGSEVWIDGEIAVDTYVYCKQPSIILLDGVRSEMRYPIWDSVVELEDGTILTLEDGKILKVEAKEGEAPAEPADSETAPASTEGLSEEKMNSEMKNVIENITKKLEEVIEENTKLKQEVEELGKQPAATKLGMSSKSNTKETYWDTLARIVKD